MRNRISSGLFCALASFAALGLMPWACAPRPLIQSEAPSAAKSAPSPAPTFTPSDQPPELTIGQLFGFRQPPYLTADPDTGKMAQAQVIAAYERLKVAAAQNGWHLILVSGYRSYWHQVQIWNDRYHDVSPDNKLPEAERLRAVMAYVDLPGLSRHQWGTELDISEESLRGQLLHQSDDLPERIKNFYLWMDENAPNFGFCRTYKGTGGLIQDEPWHWSYQPYSRVYNTQLQAITDFSLIQQDKVEGSDYILKHFNFIYKGLEKSVDPGCSR